MTNHQNFFRFAAVSLQARRHKISSFRSFVTHLSPFLHHSSLKYRTVTTDSSNEITSKQWLRSKKYLRLIILSTFNPWPGSYNIMKECEQNSEINQNYCSFQHILKIFAITDSFHLVPSVLGAIHSLQLIPRLNH